MCVDSKLERALHEREEKKLFVWDEEANAETAAVFEAKEDEEKKKLIACVCD